MRRICATASDDRESGERLLRVERTTPWLPTCVIDGATAIAQEESSRASRPDERLATNPIVNSAAWRAAPLSPMRSPTIRPASDESARPRDALPRKAWCL